MDFQKKTMFDFRFTIRLHVLYGYICTYNFTLMDTKLTLKLDKSVIEKAKDYASAHQRSLSAIIESYLQSLATSGEGIGEQIEISSFVKSMSSGPSIPSDLDLKREYGEHLADKYK
jgi:hypothetical protein